MFKSIVSKKLGRYRHFIVGFLAFLWVILRSGTNPARLAYPCQRASLPLAFNWLLAIIAFAGGSLVLRRVTKYAAIPLIIIGVAWFTGALPDISRSNMSDDGTLPIWEVDDPVSMVFVMDSIPPTTGSLAPGDTTVPDEYLPDPTIDTLLEMMSRRGVNLYRTAFNPEGIVGADNVVIIKGNFQWTSYNTTSTDRIKGLIWRILQHPEGFTGEIIVCDNTQEIGTGINENDNNSEDPEQSLPDVVSTFYAKGYPLYYIDWRYMWDVVAEEYSTGDYNDGYVYESSTKISYPKFLTPSGDHYVSLRYGIWDPQLEEYDSEKLCIIDFPVLKAHSMAGSTIALKNWIGTLTTAHADQRYGGWNNMHYTYLFGDYALVARVMAATFPRLTIVDAAWTTTYGPDNLRWVEETRMIAASPDPAASSWYTAKFMLTPIARYPNNTDPDNPSGLYYGNINGWTSYLADSAGFACTRDSSEISVYDRSVLESYPEPLVDIDMLPDNAPVIVPAGGRFTYTGMLENNTAEPRRGDVWIKVIMPDGTVFGPLNIWRNIPMAPFQTIVSAGVSQSIPDAAPVGNYTYISYAGYRPNIIVDSACFDVTVTAAVSVGSDDWETDGWFDDHSDNGIPSKTQLLRNYPNPFNAVTTIKYEVPCRSLVRLDIYNLRGQRVRSLIDDIKESGIYTINWDAADYPSGIYFGRLTIGDNEINRKMLLIK